MQKLTSKGIESYLRTNYGECRHNPKAIAVACRKVASKIKCSPKDVFHFMVEDTPIPGMYTHSYGFHTRTGREIVHEFESFYYQSL